MELLGWNWDQKLKVHREELEREEEEKRQKLERAKTMEKSLKLLKLCVDYLRKNSTTW